MSVVLLRCGTAGSGGGLTLGQKAALHQSLGLESPWVLLPGRGGICTVPNSVAEALARALRLDLPGGWGAGGWLGRSFERHCWRVRLFAVPAFLRGEIALCL